MMRRMAAGIVLLASWSLARAVEVDPAVLEAEDARIRVIERVQSSVLAIFGPAGGGGGSGVIISADGYALSNFHVTTASGNWMKCGTSDGHLYDAVIVGIDPTGDVALLKLLGRDDFPFANLGDSDLLEAGDWVYVMGNPFLLAMDFRPTVTYGIVSGAHRYQYPAGTLLEYADCIQTDASINPGNSGGPLFNTLGQVVGINGRGSFEKRGRVNVGVGYAISINQIKNFLGHLKSGRVVDHATLGARVASDAEGRVVVADILEQSDAYRRGLRYDDEIIRCGGRPISTVNQFKNVLGIYPKGWRIGLSFRREGETFDVTVRLAGVHREGELWQKTMGRRRAQPPQQPPHPLPRPRPKPDSPSPEPRAGQGVPQIVKDHLEARRGYANYHFNRVGGDRIWKAFLSHGDFTGLVGPWNLSGQAEGAGEVRIDLSDEEIAAILPAGPVAVPIAEPLNLSAEPAGSGGLLTALYMWRRMLVLGPKEFGNVEYLGAMPLATDTRMHDVLVATHGEVESRFFFDPAVGHLVAIEMFPSEEADPCELYFSEYTDVEGRQMPGRIEVRHGDNVYGVYKLSDFLLSESAEE